MLPMGVWLPITMTFFIVTLFNVTIESYTTLGARPLVVFPGGLLGMLDGGVEAVRLAEGTGA
jgi:hypothetical protein